MKKNNLFIILFTLLSTYGFSIIQFYGPKGEYQGQAIDLTPKPPPPILVLPKQPPNAAESFGQGLGEGISQGLALAIQRNKQISKVKTALEGMLVGYSKENHSNYMKIILGSEFPYSMKFALVHSYNAYRKKRNALDLYQINKYQILAKRIIKNNPEISKTELISLITLMDPTIDQNPLNQAINLLKIENTFKKEIFQFVDSYYRDRRDLYKELEKAEKALIITYVC